MTHSVTLTGALVLAGWLLGGGGVATGTESTPEGKPEPPPTQRPKDPDVKPKEPETRPKESDSKPAEQKPKEADVKPKESETKSKEVESKPKDAEPKSKEPSVKTKETEHKTKESEKIKETEQKAKDSDLPPENPCPTVAHPAEQKAAAGLPLVPSDNAAGEHPKAVEPESKKPIRSSMVTAKLRSWVTRDCFLMTSRWTPRTRIWCCSGRSRRSRIRRRQRISWDVSMACMQ